VRSLADGGGYSLFSDGSFDHERSPAQRLFHEYGNLKSAAALVAIPSNRDLSVTLPALYMPDSLSAMDAAFPLEYLALVVAKYVAYMVPGCLQICSDCLSAIDKHGQLPCISRFAPLDRIWPALSSTPLRDMLPLGADGTEPKVTHIHSHADKRLKRSFDQLSFEAKGNCIADRVAAGHDSLYNIRMELVTISVEMLLSCTLGASSNWMRLRSTQQGWPRLCHNLHYQEALHRTKRIETYWLERTIATGSGYIWVHGHSRLAAAAGLVGSKAMVGKVGTIKLIHDKFWWGNKHNPNRSLCEHCATLLGPMPDDLADTAAWMKRRQDTLTGMEHWGAGCMDPRVVQIRRESEVEARAVVQERLGKSKKLKDALQCANFLLECMLGQPYRFQGRFDLHSSEVMKSEINKRTTHISKLVKTMVRCVRIFLEAGKDIYSLRTPGQALARARQRMAYKASQVERSRESSAKFKAKEAARFQRQLEAEDLRLANELAAAGQTLIPRYFTPPAAIHSPLPLLSSGHLSSSGGLPHTARRPSRRTPDWSSPGWAGATP